MPNYRTDVLYYAELANELIEKYESLRRDQIKLDDVSRLAWRLPPGMPAWARPFRTTVPYDAIKAGVRVLSALSEQVTIDPYAFEENALGDLTAAKKKANYWETALKWQMDKAAQRRDILRQDVTRSALMYDEVVGQIVHLPTQIKTIQKLGGNPNRQKAALRYGDYAVLIRNPQSVYTRWSDYMLEAVLYVTVRTPQQIMDFWNNPELGRLIEDEEASKKYILFDYVDYSRRVVFCYPGEYVSKIIPGSIYKQGIGDAERELPAEVIELLNEEWKLDFLPWASVVGGTALFSRPEEARFPLLYGLVKSDSWNNTNIIGSLVLSEAIAEAARPDVARMGVMPDAVTAEYGEVGGTWDVPAGHEVKDMAQRGLDPALREAYDRQVGDMSRTTIPQVLVTAEMGPEEPFAGFNLRLQQAMASLLPYKILADRWFEEAYRLMLYWAKESGKPIEAPGGERIEPTDIDKDRIYLSVSLQEDVPIDKQQRMATAIQASRELKIPTRDILEMLGETDPDRKIKEWMQEQLTMSYLGGVVQQIQTDASGALQQAAVQMAQQIVQQAMQQGGQQGGPQAPMMQPGGGGGEGPTPFGPPGIEGIEGGSVNPAEGGAPPAGFAPGATREFQTGQTRTGEQVLA